mgnify:CR=1 FL=1
MVFARFGYRYKYKNNEVSAFSPFTNPAFIPGQFNYSPSQGYNLGMVNNVRELVISNFRPDATAYPDVVSVDILYKATNNSNVYVVDTFEPNDPEWIAGAGENGSFTIESEIITSVVNANQLLRPYDNVPKTAKSQEVTASRIIYGNYKQGYDTLNTKIPKIEATVVLALSIFSCSVAFFRPFGNEPNMISSYSRIILRVLLYLE